MLSFEEQKEEKLRERIRKKRDSMRCLRAKRKAAKEYMNYLLAGGTPSFVATPSPTHITSNNNAINCSSTLHLYNEEEFDIKSLDINYIHKHAKQRMSFNKAVKDGEKLYKLAKERPMVGASVIKPMDVTTGPTRTVPLIFMRTRKTMMRVERGLVMIITLRIMIVMRVL